MKQLPDFTAVIFDLDGLVLDTETTYRAAWQQAAQLMGYEFSNEFCLSFSGLHYPAIKEKILANYGQDFDLSLFSRLSDECWQDYVQQQGIARKPGVDSLLTVIQNYDIPFCLATNSLEINARECLALAGLESAFPLLMSRDQVQQGKPAPDIFLKAAQLLQYPIHQCLVLEDSLTGVQAAKVAGAISVLIPSLLPASKLAISYSDAVFADLLQVAEIIRTLQ
jgi:HAD superfamily hydrolase (TIGR01509 family)